MLAREGQTLDTYSHVLPGMQEEAAAVIPSVASLAVVVSGSLHPTQIVLDRSDALAVFNNRADLIVRGEP